MRAGGYYSAERAAPRIRGPIVSLRIVSAAAAPCRIREDMQPAARLQRAGRSAEACSAPPCLCPGRRGGRRGGGAGPGILHGHVIRAPIPPRSDTQAHEGRAYLRRAATGRQAGERGEGGEEAR